MNPATEVFAHAELSIGKGIPNGSMVAWQSVICAAASGALGVMLFPGSPEAAFDIQDHLAESQVNEWQKWKLHPDPIRPVLAGCVAYNDAVTHKPHHTPFAFEIYVKGATSGSKDRPTISAILPSDFPAIEAADILPQEWMIGSKIPD
jgi:hypothetical protein